MYCIPDNYEVLDSSLADIKHNLDPTYNPEYVSKLDMEVKYSRGIDGTEFIPGTVGLNNLKNTAYLNVIIQVTLPVLALPLLHASCASSVLTGRALPGAHLRLGLARLLPPALQLRWLQEPPRAALRRAPQEPSLSYPVARVPCACSCAAAAAGTGVCI